MKQGWIVVSLLAVLGGCVLLLVNLGQSGERNGRILEVFCATGVEKPVAELAQRFEDEFGIKVQLRYGGTGALLSQIQVTKRGDVFIAADELAVEVASEQGFVAEAVPLASQFPVIAVRSGNPKEIRSISDLLRDDVRVAIGNPGAASIGNATKRAMAERWRALEEKAVVMKLAVTDLAQDLEVGAVDAAVIWNSTVPQFGGLEAVRMAPFDAVEDTVSACVLTVSERVADAEKFVRYLSDADKGGVVFRRMHFEEPR